MMTPAFSLAMPRLFRTLSSLTLWTLAMVHLLVLASFLLLLAMSPARAQQSQPVPACHGEDLLAQLQREHPERYAEILQEASTVVNGKGLFWKIEKEGLDPSYLLGTMHVTDPRVLEMPPGAAEAHVEARTIVIESDELLDEKKAMAAMLAKPELTMFTDGRSIETLLSAEDLAILEGGLKKRGLALGAVSRMKPWMLASFIALPACELARKAQNAVFLDKQIALDAIAAGKPVKGLETMAEQLTAMAELPLEFHLEALVETVKLGERMDDVTETMTALYLRGETGLTIPALKAITPTETGDDESAYAAFESTIISQRNHTMAERGGPILGDGGVFMAVGALHLPGDDGLVELLRKQGFTLTMIR